MIVSPTRVVADVLDAGGDEADLAGPERLVDLDRLRREHADPVDLVDRAGAHHPDLLALGQRAVAHSGEDHDAQIRIVPAVDQQRLERRLRLALRRRQARDDRLQHLVDAGAGLGRDQQRVIGAKPDDVLDLLLDPRGLGCRQVDLVQHRHDLVVGIDRLVGIGQRLRLDALGRIDQQQRALAGAQGPADLVGEVDVARRVDQVQLVVFPIFRLVGEPDGLGLDRDPTLALEIHAVEHLALHLARLEPAAALDDPIGERRLAMIDMGDDRKVADALKVGHRRSGLPSWSASVRSGLEQPNDSADGPRRYIGTQHPVGSGRRSQDGSSGFGSAISHCSMPIGSRCCSSTCQTPPAEKMIRLPARGKQPTSIRPRSPPIR